MFNKIKGLLLIGVVSLGLVGCEGLDVDVNVEDTQLDDNICSFCNEEKTDGTCIPCFNYSKAQGLLGVGYSMEETMTKLTGEEADANVVTFEMMLNEHCEKCSFEHTPLDEIEVKTGICEHCDGEFPNTKLNNTGTMLLCDDCYETSQEVQNSNNCVTCGKFHSKDESYYVDEENDVYACSKDCLYQYILNKDN